MGSEAGLLLGSRAPLVFFLGGGGGEGGGGMGRWVSIGDTGSRSWDTGDLNRSNCNCLDEARRPDSSIC